MVIHLTCATGSMPFEFTQWKIILYQERIVRLQQAVALLTMEKKEQRENSRFLKRKYIYRVVCLFPGCLSNCCCVSKTLKGRREREREYTEPSEHGILHC
jgi:hypothetical protein